MATALDRWDEEGGAQDVAWPLPYEASATWSAESWNVWVPPLSANGICLLTSNAGSSSTRPGQIARRRRVEDADRPFPA
jgi:hypothetical protein